MRLQTRYRNTGSGSTWQVHHGRKWTLPQDRPVVKAALEKEAEAKVPVVALQLPTGKIITGKQSDTMTASAACLLNCIKELAEIGDSIHLLPPVILNAIG